MNAFAALRPSRLRSLAAPLLVIAAIAAFVALATPAIELPGLYYDELFEVVPSLAFVKGGLGSAVAEVPQSQIWIFGHPLPVMAQPYNGGLKTILFIPIAAIFGITAASVRLFTIGVAALALWLYYLFARRLFRCPAIGAIAVALLALDPSFIDSARVDYAPSALMFLFKALALWQLTAWWQTRRTGSLVVGSFALGLGTYDKVTFLWVVAAVLVAALILRPGGLRSRLNLRRLAFGAGAFLMGSLPLVVFNLSWPPRSLGPLLAGTVNLKYGNYKGDFGAQLLERVRKLSGLLEASGRPVLAIYAAVASAAIVVLFIRRSSRRSTRPAMFVLLSGVGVVLATALTPGADTSHHLLLVYPFPHLAVAAVAVQIYELAKPRLSRVSLVFALALATLLAVPPALGALETWRNQDELKQSGGLGNFSDGIYRLNDFLLANDAGQHIVVLDWGIYYNLVGLSGWKLHCTQLWLQLNNPDSVKPPLLGQLTQPDYRYVLHVRSATNFMYPRDHFFAASRHAHLQPRIEQTIRTRLGLPLFEVYRLDHS